MVEPAFISVLLASLSGLIVSILIERWMTPQPLFVRPLAAWAIHTLLWFFSFALLVLLLGRPWFAMATVLAFLLMLVMVNNAKFHSLQEPFVWHDFEYFTDAIKYPRLYIPFLGWGNFFLAATGFITAVSIGFFLEAIPQERFVLNGQLGGIVTLWMISLFLIATVKSKKLNVTFDAKHDVTHLGLLASLWQYAKECNTFPAVSSDFTHSAHIHNPKKPLANIVAVQSESFFDVRELFSGIKHNVLSEFDRLKDEAIVHGKLNVPAWGANTVRSEFAFLSGLNATKLGVHRFNPYRAVAKGWDIYTMAHFLKSLGYRTIAIHPYPITFYQRNTVYPRMGFDEFLDITSFNDAKRFGPYVSDMAVADKIKKILSKTEQPVFIFAITMENHGPLHLEQVTAADSAELYTVPPPKNCTDLTIYLRHLRNANKMMASLRETLEQSPYPAKLCWFGDHVPIMPSVYKHFGKPNGEVDYVLWSNQKSDKTMIQNLSISNLAMKIVLE